MRDQPPGQDQDEPKEEDNETGGQEVGPVPLLETAVTGIGGCRTEDFRRERGVPEILIIRSHHSITCGGVHCSEWI